MALKVSVLPFILCLVSPIYGDDVALYQKCKVYDVQSSSIQAPNPEKGETYEPKNVKDGADWTRWSSHFSDNEWLLLDLGHPQEISRVEIYWQDAYAVEYDIEIETPEGPPMVLRHIENGDGGVDEVDLNTIVARKVKLSFRKRATEWGYSIWEVKVFRKSG